MKLQARIFWLVCLGPALTAQPLAYVSSGHEVSVIDLGSQQRMSSIPLPQNGSPGSIAATADGRRLYAADGPGVAVVDLETRAVRQIDMGPLAGVGTGLPIRVREARLSPDETRLYVEVNWNPDPRNPATASTLLLILDVATEKVLASIPLYDSGKLLMAPDGSRVFHVSDFGAITAIEPKADSFPVSRAWADVGLLGGGGAAITPDGKRLLLNACLVNLEWLRNGFNILGGLLVVDTSTLEVTGMIEVAGCPSAIAVAPDGRQAYAAADYFIDVVDLSSNTETGLLPMPASYFWEMAITADGRSLWGVGDSLAGVDIAGRHVIAAIKGILGSGLAMEPQAPSVDDSGLLDGASLQPRVARGGTATLFGSALARGSRAVGSNRLPASLLDTVVTLNGTPVPLFFVSANQVNLQIPWEVSGAVSMQVGRGPLASTPRNVTIEEIAPAIFQAEGQGGGLILHSDTHQLVTPQAPAHAGEILTIFATGLGMALEAVPSGQPPDTPLPAVAEVRVTIGGVDAEVLSSTLSTATPGVYEIRIRLGSVMVPGAEVPVVLSVDGVFAPPAHTSIERE